LIDISDYFVVSYKQNWDQDQLWRYAVAMENWIEDYAKVSFSLFYKSKR